ncbi:MAG: cyanophycinase, partial [Gemmatimonadetes bacterium]|nr:cyanophycinase [Gemmatimonadota bacterium]
GASAMSGHMLAQGSTDLLPEKVEVSLGAGLGFVHRVVIDQHFSERQRLSRLLSVVAQNPYLQGIGIDEDTALVVRGHLGTVVGAGGVTFVDGRDSVRFDNAGDLDKGRQLTLSHLRVGIVGTNYQLNLRERELEVLVQGEASPHRRTPPFSEASQVGD